MITGEIIQNIDLSDQDSYNSFFNRGTSKHVKRTLTEEERQQRRFRRQNTINDLKAVTRAVSDSIRMFKAPAAQQPQQPPKGIDYSYELGVSSQGKGDQPSTTDGNSLEKYILWGTGLIIVGIVAYKVIKNKQTSTNP